MLKIGQNWGKIANYPPQCLTKIGTTVLDTDSFVFFSLYSQTSVIERFCSRPNRFSTKKLRLRFRT